MQLNSGVTTNPLFLRGSRRTEGKEREILQHVDARGKQRVWQANRHNKQHSICHIVRPWEEFTVAAMRKQDPSVFIGSPHTSNFACTCILNRKNTNVTSDRAIWAAAVYASCTVQGNFLTLRGLCCCSQWSLGCTDDLGLNAKLMSRHRNKESCGLIEADSSLPQSEEEGSRCNSLSS